MVISHNSALLEAVANKVFHLDAERTTLDIYNVGWKTYLAQRETDARRRHREAAGARRQAAVLQAQADRMRAKATKARAAQGMERRAQRLLAGVAEERRGPAGGEAALPRARAVRQDTAVGTGPVQVLRLA